MLVGIVALWSGCASYTLEAKNVNLYNEGVKILDSIQPKSKVRIEVGQGKVGGSSGIPLAIFYTLEAKNVNLYNEGVKILDSIQPKSKVRIEVGQGKVGGSSGIPLAIFILAQNLANQPTLFDKTNVRIYQNNQEIPALSEGELKTDGYDFGSVIESYHLYLPPAPMPDVPVGIPFVYRGYMGGFYVYDYMIISARERMQQQMRLDENRAKRAIILASVLQKNTLEPKGIGFYVYDYMIISARERMQQQMRLDENRAKRAIILASVLQKNTLEPKGMPKGGFMLYAPSGFKEGLIQVSVSVNGEIHSFELELKK